ncbi:MAG: Phosphoesterase, PA-phosphatase related, partial [Armatimonadetes bacterium]|nr:Phosphoesterase, PA-phosphatase related [Armatimonadota bacterium]
SQAGAAQLLQAPAAAARKRRNDPLDLGAANWATWLSSSPAKLLPPAPPKPNSAVTRREIQELLTLQNQRTDAIRALVSFWDLQGGVRVWTNIYLDVVKATNYNPVVVSRGLALLHTAMADAAIAVWNAKAQYKRRSPDQQHGRLTNISSVSSKLPSYASEHAAIASAASTVLNYLFPTQLVTLNGQSLTFDAAANQAALSRLWAGANYRTDLVAGQLIGEAVGRAAVLRGLTDGSAAAFTGSVPVGAQYWVPTPPANAGPLLPLAGRWNPWLMSSGDQFRAPAPNVYADGAFTAAFLQDQVNVVKTVTDARTEEQAAIALFWADGGGTVTPPGHWTQIGMTHVWNAEWSTPRAARALALLSVALADAAICCWDSKYAYWVPRPITAIRSIAGQPFTDPTWSPLIGTPPFPAYTSGHSTFSGAAATVLEHLFPNGTATDALGETVSFDTAASQAKDSRLYAGIHFPMDNEVGLQGGQMVGDLVIGRAESDGAGPAPE